MSTLVDGWGNWHLALPVSDCAHVQLRLQATGPRGSEAEMTRSLCQVQPAPALVLDVERASQVYLPIVLRVSR